MKIQLKRSNVLEGGVAKAPTTAQMEYGEIAVNYNTIDPTLFIKDSANGIVRIGDDSKALADLQTEIDNLQIELDKLEAELDKYSQTIPDPITDPNHQDDTLDERYVSRFSWSDLPDFATAP